MLRRTREVRPGEPLDVLGRPRPRQLHVRDDVQVLLAAFHRRVERDANGDAVTTPPEGLFPVTQDNVHAAFDWVFAPWIKEMGLTDFVVREGYLLDAAADERPAEVFLRRGVRAGAHGGDRHGGGDCDRNHGPRSARARSISTRISFGLRRTTISGSRRHVKRFGKASAYVDCSVTFAGRLANWSPTLFWSSRFKHRDG